MEFPFRIFGSTPEFDQPENVHILIPYCLKSPECPFDRMSDMCRFGCGLCDAETIIKWAEENGYRYCVTRGSVFYETYLPKYRDTMRLLITFGCKAGFIEDDVNKLIETHGFSLIFIETDSTCKTDDVEAAKDGRSKLQNHIAGLEEKLSIVENYLQSIASS